MKIALAKEMREIDRKAIQYYGIPEIVLMENAGAAVARSAEKILHNLQGKKIAVFAGKGNNGGDAFVAARHLDNAGAKVKVYLIGELSALESAAKINAEILKKMNISPLEVSSERDWDKVRIGLAFSDLLLDGLLGTGFHGELNESMARIINMLNDSLKPIVAIDIPSGVEVDTGNVPSVAIQAVCTVTFGLPKVGVLLYPGARYAGNIVVGEIGLPQLLLDNETIKQNMINDSVVNDLLVKRLPDAHKNSCGKVLVIAGSKGLTGAACLVSRAAMRVGAGVVTLAVAESLHDIVEHKLTEVMTCPLPEVEKGVIGEASLPKLLALAQKHDVIEIGSGLGQHPQTIQLIRQLMEKTNKQLIVDADAIHACAGDQDVIKRAQVMPILTPHLGEMAALTEYSIKEIKDNFIDTARECSRRLNVILVLKDARTVVAYPDGNVYINIKGNAGMATAGSGDVLAGVISGLFSQGLLNCSAAVAGVYLHALAGDLAAERGMVGLIAGDIVESLPSARLKLEKQIKI